MDGGALSGRPTLNIISLTFHDVDSAVNGLVSIGMGASHRPVAIDADARPRPAADEAHWRRRPGRRRTPAAGA